VNASITLPADVAWAIDGRPSWVTCWMKCALGTKSTFKLLEALAGAIGAKIQELYPRAAVSIELEKLAPPCPGVPASCGVRLHLPVKI